MAQEFANLYATLEARDNVSRTLGAVQGKLNGLTGMLRGALGAAAAAVGLRSLEAVFQATLGSASNLNETVQKTQQVFGTSAGQVLAFGDQMASAFGLSRQSVLDAASNIGLVAEAAGLSEPAAAGLSTQLASLAADASSFYNIGLDEALLKIRSALVGESEPIRSMGVLLNEAAVNAEAARLGIAKMGAKLTEGQKVQARSSLIIKGLATAQGDLARTASSPANMMRILAGRAQNLATDLGASLMPAFQSLLAVAGGAMGRIGAAFQASRGIIGAWAARVGGWLGQVPALFGQVVTFFAPLIAAIQTYFSAILGVLGRLVGGVDVGAWAQRVGVALTFVRDGLAAMYQTAASVITGVADFLAPVGAAFWDFATTVGVAVQEFVAAVAEIGAAIPGLIGQANLVGWGQQVGGIFTWLRDTIASWFETAAFAMRNWGDIAALTGITVMESLTNAGEIFSWLGSVVQTFLSWFGSNWKTIFADAFEVVTTALINLGQNFRDFGSAVVDWITSGFQQPFNFQATPLMQGMADLQTPAMETPALNLSNRDAQRQAIMDQIAGREQDRAAATEAGRAMAVGDEEAAVAATTDQAPAGLAKPKVGPEPAPAKQSKAEMVGLTEFASKALTNALGKPDDKLLGENQKQTDIQRAQLLKLSEIADKGGGLTLS